MPVSSCLFSILQVSIWRGPVLHLGLFSCPGRPETSSCPAVPVRIGSPHLMHLPSGPHSALALDLEGADSGPLPSRVSIWRKPIDAAEIGPQPALYSEECHLLALNKDPRCSDIGAVTGTGSEPMREVCIFIFTPPRHVLSCCLLAAFCLI